MTKDTFFWVVILALLAFCLAGNKFSKMAEKIRLLEKENFLLKNNPKLKAA